MNTKTDGISSGLVAVAWNGGDMGREWTTDKIVAESWVNNSKTQQAIPVVLLEDAEAIIAQKDAEILDQCRINGMGAEREATLLGKVERQSAALKLARQVLMSVKETSSSTRLRRIVDEPLAAINEVLGEVK